MHRITSIAVQSSLNRRIFFTVPWRLGFNGSGRSGRRVAGPCCGYCPWQRLQGREAADLPGRPDFVAKNNPTRKVFYMIEFTRFLI